MVVNVREQSSILANKGRPICVNINISITKSIRIMLSTADIKLILIGRIRVLGVNTLFEFFFINTCLDFSGGLL